MTLLTNNDNEANWAGTDGPDAFDFREQGLNSESWYISKNGNENGTLSVSASMPTARGVYVVWLASSVKAIYTAIGLTLQSSTNNNVFYQVADTVDRRVDGAFRAFAFDYVNQGTPTGTFNPANLTSSIFNVQMANANVRNTPNHWIDAIYYGVGHTVSGTTTTDKLFNEAWDYEYNTDTRRYGVLEKYNAIIFAQADLTLSGTSLISDAETLVFADATFGYSVYNLNITGTVTFNNTSVLTAGTKLFNLDTTGSTFSMSGGALEGGDTITLVSGTIFDGVVVSNSTLIDIQNNSDSCSFVNNGLITLNSGSLTNSAIMPAAASSVGVQTNELNKLISCDFEGDGTGHAVELTDIGDGDQDWTCLFTGYDSGVTGSPVTPTNTGNEAIYINPTVPTSANLIIRSSGTVPSIRVSANFTGAVSVVANQATVTLAPLIANSEIRIYSRDVDGKNDVELFGVENSGTSFDFTTDAGAAVNIIIFHKQYIPADIYNYIVPSSNQTVQIEQRNDRNFIGTAP
jgi:hypothetical protein